jgi:hypothetical protein
VNNFIIRFVVLTFAVFFSTVPVYLVVALHEPGFLFLYAPIMALYIAGIMEFQERSQQNTNDAGGR